MGAEILNNVGFPIGRAVDWIGRVQRGLTVEVVGKLGVQNSKILNGRVGGDRLGMKLSPSAPPI